MTRADIRRLILSVYLPTVFFMFGIGLLVPILPLYATEAGGSYALAGFVVSAGWAGQALGALPVGMFLKRVGFRQAVIIGGVLFGGGTIALGFVDTAFAMVVLRLISGLGIAVFIISRHTYLAQTVPVASRGRAISFFVGANRFGHFAGPLIGGFVGHFYGLSAAIMVGGAVAAVVILLSLTMFREPAIETRESHGGAFDLTVFMEAIKYNPRAFISGAAAQSFVQVIRAGRQIIIPLVGAFTIGLDTAQVGQIVSISTAIDVLLFIPAGIIMDRWGRKAAAVPSFIIMGIGMLLIPLAGGYISLLLIACLVGVGQGIGTGTMMTIGADLAPPGRTGEFLAIWRLTSDSSHTVAPLAIGGLADVIGLAFTSGLTGGIGFVAAIVLAVFVRETRKQPEEKPAPKSSESVP